jgi:hypothetical protein
MGAGIKSSKKTVPSWVKLLCQDTQHQTFFITGGLGSGKTVGSTIAFLTKVLTNPKVKQWWDVAPIYTQADNTLLPTYFFILSSFFNMQETRDFVLVKSRPNFLHILTTDQKIYLHSGDRPERMVAATIGGYRITEAGIQKRAVWEGCAARARDKKVGVPIGIIEGCPEGDNWFREEGDFIKTVPEKKYRRFVLHTSDNAENLTPGYIDTILNVYASRPEKLKSYLFGEFVSFNRGSAYWDFYESQNVVYNQLPKSSAPLVISWDFNVAPLSWVALQEQKFFAELSLTRLERVAVLRESSGKSRGLLSACAEFVSWLDPEKNQEFRHTPILIDGGHDGYAGSIHSDQCAFFSIRDHLKQYFSDVRVVANRGAPGRQDRLERVNTLFAYKRYVIDSCCPQLINSYNSTSLKPGTWELIKNAGKDTTHYSDAGDYGVLNLAKDFNLDGKNKAKKVSGISRL